MSRSAPVAHPVASFVAERRSPRSFSDQPVTRADALPEELARREIADRSRVPQESFAFSGRFAGSAS